jgi:uncharacterized protein YkwD
VFRLLPSFAVAACAAALAVVPLASPAATAGDCTAPASFRPSDAALAGQVISLVNAHRASLGLRTLKVSPTLTASAVWKARHMATYGYMAHDDPAPPVARTAAQRIAACGYRGTGWGENIAAGYTTAASVVAAWLASPGHKANIENPAYTVTGAGAAAASGAGVLWAQDFGITDDSGTTAPTPKPKQSSPQTLVLRGLHVTRGAKRIVAHATAVLAPSMARVRHGSTGCAATFAGRKLTVVERRFAGGAVTCAWRAPVAGTVVLTVMVSSAKRATHVTYAVTTP